MKYLRLSRIPFPLSVKILLIFFISIGFLATITTYDVESFCGGLGCSPAVHQEITADALSFINPSVLADINDEHAFQEIVGFLDSDEHFDNCSFSGGAAEINANYQDALNQANPSNFDSGDLADQFGQLLHAVQDFYSHSNWVDLGQTTLVDRGLGLWSPMNPYSLRDGVLFVQGEDETPFGSDSSLSINGNIVMVNTGNSPPAGLSPGTYRGVISGTFGLVDDCPDNVSLSHGDLSKDVPGKLMFDEAKALGLKQTRHEWCRLVSLVEQRYPGNGKQALFDNWVVDESKANAACGGNVDVVLIIDSSGSMGWNDPTNNRLTAGRAYLTASVDGDFVGVVDFDGGSRIASSLQRLPDNKTSLINAINTINSSGGTNIGGGVQTGCNVLSASTSGNSIKGAILLTDGVGSFSGQDSCFSSQGWKIFTFGFGSSDDALLQQIASNTGGEFTRLSTSNLVCEFQRVRSKIAGLTPGPCTATQVNPNSTTSLTTTVPPGQGQATFSSSWPGSDVVMTLTAPSGRVIDRNTTAPDVTHDVGPTFEVYTITNPEVGEWQVDLFGADLPPSGEEVIFGFSSIPTIPPIADAGGPYQGTAGNAITLDASGSSDPDGTIVLYEWDLDGDSEFDDATGVNPEVVFGTAGAFTIGLRVTDDSGATDTDTAEVNVSPATCPDDVLLSSYQTSPSDAQYVDITNVGSSTINVGNCSFAAFNVFTERSIGDATVTLSGSLAPGETFRVGSAGVSGVDAVIPDGALPGGPGGLSLLDASPPADGTLVSELLPDNITGMVYLDTTMVFGISHLRVPAHDAIYDCVYGGSGTGPFTGPFTPVADCPGGS